MSMTYSSISGFESLKLRLGLVFEYLLRHHAPSYEGLESIGRNVPYFFVVAMQRDNDAG